MKKNIKKIIMILYSPIRILITKKILNYSKKNKYNKILNFKFYHLDFIKNKNLSKFKEIKKNIEATNIERINKKKKIKIGFVLYTSSMWSCDKLFKKLKQNDRYEPYIIVCELNDGTKESRKNNYNSTLDYFQKNGYSVIGLNEKSKVNFNTIGQPDIIFYMTPFAILPKELNIKRLSLKILTVYIPYSFMIAEREEKFNLPMYQLTWRFFTDTLIYKNLIKEKCLTGDDNVVFCGYTRMDELLDLQNNNEKEIWKIPESNNKIYKIIYAPHHSVFDEKAGFSTFDQNYKFMYELAKKYQKNTSWIIKPHPLLRGRIIRNGFFKDVSEYDNYLKMWDKLPNAKVVTDGTYFDIFKTSDTMILDSVSFLAEYQYVHKPLLLLTRETQHFNSFGNELLKVLYLSKGNDFDRIENYLKNIIIDGQDSMKEKRTEFFNKYLDYYNYNNKQLASEYIYNYLEDVFQETGELDERK